jgi:cation transport regulator
LAAYNNAWEEYKDPKKRRGKESREQVSHKVAWSAVERVYHKNEQGKWVGVKRK